MDNISRSTEHKVTVFSSSLDYNHPKKLTRYLKGDARIVFKKNIRDLKPSKLRELSLKQSSKVLIREGNLQTIKSDTVIRKVRSERLALHDRHRDDE